MPSQNGFMKPAAAYSRGHRRRGSTLVLATVVSIVVLVVAAASFRSALFQHRMAYRSSEYQLAIAVAEAGAERAMNELNRDSAQWGSPWATAGSGTYTIQENLNDHYGNPVGTYRARVEGVGTQTPLVRATGYIPALNDEALRRSVALEAEQNVTRSPFGDFGIYTNQTLSLSSNVIINADIGTNNRVDLKLNSNVSINGNVQIGGSISGLGGSNVNISGTQVTGAPGTPPPPYPDADHNIARTGNANGTGSIDWTFEAANIKYYNSSGNLAAIPFKDSSKRIIELSANNSRLEFTAPGDYYLGGLLFSGERHRVRVPANGQVRLFIDAGATGDPAIKSSKMVALNGGSVNGAHHSSGGWTTNQEPAGDPAKLSIFVKRGKIEFGQYSTVYAGIYAPTSEINSNQYTEMYGVLIGGLMNVNQYFRFHVANSLLGTGGGDGAFPRVWAEVSFHL